MRIKPQAKNLRNMEVVDFGKAKHAILTEVVSQIDGWVYIKLIKKNRSFKYWQFSSSIVNYKLINCERLIMPGVFYDFKKSQIIVLIAAGAAKNYLELFVSWSGPATTFAHKRQLFSYTWLNLLKTSSARGELENSSWLLMSGAEMTRKPFYAENHIFQLSPAISESRCF